MSSTPLCSRAAVCRHTRSWLDKDNELSHLLKSILCAQSQRNAERKVQGATNRSVVLQETAPGTRLPVGTVVRVTRGSQRRFQSTGETHNTHLYGKVPRRTAGMYTARKRSISNVRGEVEVCFHVTGVRASVSLFEIFKCSICYIDLYWFT